MWSIIKKISVHLHYKAITDILHDMIPEKFLVLFVVVISPTQNFKVFLSCNREKKKTALTTASFSVKVDCNVSLTLVCRLCHTTTCVSSDFKIANSMAQKKNDWEG